MRTVIVILAIAVIDVAEAIRGESSSKKVAEFYLKILGICAFMDIAEFIFMFIK